jgi:hypothetical protein
MLEVARHQLAHVAVVFDQQDAGLHGNRRAALAVNVKL